MSSRFIKAKTKSFLAYGIFLLILLSLPASCTSSLRGLAISSMNSWFCQLSDIKLLLKTPFNHFITGENGDLVCTQNQEIQRLLLENQLLGNELANLQELVAQEFYIFHELIDESLMKLVSKDAALLHEQEVLKHFHFSISHLPARVIFRPLNTWDNTLWIDKGEADNKALGRVVIAKNSPVVLGLSVVGVIDQVGKHQSLVRLITDSSMKPSVRVIREGKYLAKGELVGLADQAWRGRSTLLKGVGFNYDRQDPEGPSRDLRRGQLVRPGDLLVTSGLDGVFPRGLHMGNVEKIFPLKEGDYAFQLQAKAAAGNLSELSLVFVLPPITR